MARRKRRSNTPDARKARALRAALEKAGVRVHKVFIRDGRLHVQACRSQHRCIMRIVATTLKARIVGAFSDGNTLAGPLVPVQPGAGLTWEERMTGAYGHRPVA